MDLLGRTHKVPGDRKLVVAIVKYTRPTTGLRAILFAALLAAAMSSLDSALNSLSASTISGEPTSKK